MTEILEGPSIAPLSGIAKQLVVFLHGYGADGNDLISLADEFVDLLPNAQFISPHAPFPCEMSPYGRQWFSLIDRHPSRMLEGASHAAPYLNTTLDHWMQTLSLHASSVALVGFSQGTMMSLYAAPRRGDAVAAIVGFSGALIGGDLLPKEIQSKPPVMLVHGDADMVVPFAAMADAEKHLLASDISIETHRRPQMGHGIDQMGIQLAQKFLSKHLNKKQ